MSLNGDSDYHPIDPQPAQAYTPEDKSQMSLVQAVLMAALVGALCLIIGAGFALSLDDDNNAPYDKLKPFASPEKYILSATFRAPYFGKDFNLPVTAYVDHSTGFSRIEYYSGANVWIHSKAENTDDYSFQPTYDRLQCFTSHHDGPSSLPSLFPRLEYREGESADDDSDHGPKFVLQGGEEQKKIIRLYDLQPGLEKVNDVECHVWKYSYMKNREADYESLDPDAFGHAGNYTFYVNAKTGSPVRFHQFGHNVFNGGSHMEEYIIDYQSVVAVDHHAAGLFQPPSGMPCKPDHDEVTARFRSPVDLMTGSFSHASSEDKTDLKDQLFDAWSQAHQKMYTSHQDRALRKSHFFSTKAMIDAHNQNPEKTYTLALNQFSDLSAEELKLVGSGRKRTSSLSSTVTGVNDVCSQYVPVAGDLPKSFTWTEDKLLGRYFDYVNGPSPRNKSQLSCGSCWASASTTALTARNIIVNGQNTPEDQIQELFDGASIQHTLDCTNGDEYDVHACNGGIDSWGYSWVISKNQGAVASDNSYGHFLDAAGFCHFALTDPSITNVNPWTGKPVEKYATLERCEHVGTKWNGGDDDSAKLVADLKNALFHNGPVSISIAVPMSLYFYRGGVYNDPQCGNELDDLAHSIVAVGWGVDEKTGVEYILAANSWSSMWGEEGLVRFKAEGNICGFATVPVLPHVQKV